MPGNAAGFCPAWAKISCIFGGNLLDHLVSFSNPSRVTLLSSVTHEAFPRIGVDVAIVVGHVSFLLYFCYSKVAVGRCIHV